MVNVCIAIAVARPEGGLDPLPGALSGAAAIANWAVRLGYRTVVITDAKPMLPVSLARLKAEIQPLLSDPEEKLNRVIVAFSGHGLMRDVSQELWLLSNWKTGTNEAIDVNRFKLRLRSYRPNQITIIGDACRTFSPESAGDLNGSPVLDRASPNTGDVLFDVILATEPGEPALHTPPTAPRPYCVLSHVLVKALWGQYEEAVDRQRPDGPVITSDTLRNALVKHLKPEAERLNAIQRPEVSTGFVPPDNVYARVADLGAPPHLESPSPSPPSPSPTFDHRLHGTEVLFRQLRLPRPESFNAGVDILKQRYHLDGRPPEFVSRTGVQVAGSGMRFVSTHTASEDLRAKDGEWIEFQAKAPGPLLIQCEDGRWIGAAAYPEFLVSIVVGERGAESVIYRPYGMFSAELPSARAVAQLNLGLLSNMSALDLAAQLRPFRHIDPVMGVLSAYLYARAEDRDSIRRVGAQFASLGQPVPFDVALLAELDLKAKGDLLVADLPAVQARVPRTAAEEAVPQLFAATNPARVTIAGSFPWMRQGWGLLEGSSWEPSKILLNFLGALEPAPFTTLSNDAGIELVSLVKQGRL
jgi:hypothetical protein